MILPFIRMCWGNEISITFDDIEVMKLIGLRLHDSIILVRRSFLIQVFRSHQKECDTVKTSRKINIIKS